MRSAYNRIHTNMTTSGACRTVDMILRATNPHLSNEDFQRRQWTLSEVVRSFARSFSLVRRITDLAIERHQIEQETCVKDAHASITMRDYRRAQRQSRPKNLTATERVRRRRVLYSEQRRDVVSEMNLVRYLFRQLPRIRPEPAQLMRFRMFDPDDVLRTDAWNGPNIEYVHGEGCEPLTCFRCDVSSIRSYFERLFSGFSDGPPTFYWMAEYVQRIVNADFGMENDADLPECVEIFHPYETCTDHVTLCRPCALFDAVCEQLGWGRRRRNFYDDIEFDDFPGRDNFPDPDNDDYGYSTDPDLPEEPQDERPERPVPDDPEPDNEHVEPVDDWRVEGVEFSGNLMDDDERRTFQTWCHSVKDYVDVKLTREQFMRLNRFYCNDRSCEMCDKSHSCVCHFSFSIADSLSSAYLYDEYEYDWFCHQADKYVTLERTPLFIELLERLYCNLELCESTYDCQLSHACPCFITEEELRDRLFEKEIG